MFSFCDNNLKPSSTCFGIVAGEFRPGALHKLDLKGNRIRYFFLLEYVLSCYTNCRIPHRAPQDTYGHQKLYAFAKMRLIL